ncbi:MAG: SAM-dependent methyltransferase [Planctomycetota bacterium]
MSNPTLSGPIIELLGKHRGSGDKRLLDIPAGKGPVTEAAVRLGYDVIELDLFAHKQMRGVIADACAPLPFVDESFDVVLSMEGIEHFENQTNFVRECARVLKPGGTLVLSTPNLLHMNARLSSFFTGQRLLKQGIINEVNTLRIRDGNRLYHGHAYLIDVFRMRYIMRIVGLDLDLVRGTSLSFSSLLLAPLWPAIALVSKYATWTGRRRLIESGREAPGPDVEQQLNSLARSSAVLFRKKLIYVASKPS